MPQAASIHQKHFPKQVEHYVTLEEEENMQIHFVCQLQISVNVKVPQWRKCVHQNNFFSHRQKVR